MTKKENKKKSKKVYFELISMLYDFTENTLHGMFSIDTSELDDISINSIYAYIIKHKEKYFSIHVQYDNLEISICDIDYHCVNTPVIQIKYNSKIRYPGLANDFKITTQYYVMVTNLKII